MLLVKDEFIHQKIEVKIEGNESFSIEGIENEFKHLILNIINNSKDAFNEKSIINQEIVISINSDEKKIELRDNAGGIPLDLIDDIFKANITTKEDGKGSGIGLYMSSKIAKKHNGTLRVQNTQDGANFIFKESSHV